MSVFQYASKIELEAFVESNVYLKKKKVDFQSAYKNQQENRFFIH